jgi:hypothetical protein
MIATLSIKKSLSGLLVASKVFVLELSFKSDPHVPSILLPILRGLNAVIKIRAGCLPSKDF